MSILQPPTLWTPFSISHSAATWPSLYSLGTDPIENAALLLCRTEPQRKLQLSLCCSSHYCVRVRCQAMATRAACTSQYIFKTMNSIHHKFIVNSRPLSETSRGSSEFPWPRNAGAVSGDCPDIYLSVAHTWGGCRVL
jgi:hypothetical protein